MFNPLTRTLKLGLTAITILTAGGFAGTAFAQTQPTALNRLGFCTSYIGDYRCGSTEAAGLLIVDCIADPFGTTGCAKVFTPKELIAAKTQYCGNQSVPSDSDPANPHVCRDTWDGVNAAYWATQYPLAVSTVQEANGNDQFVKGAAYGIEARTFGDYDDGRRQYFRHNNGRPKFNRYAADTEGALNLKTSTFNNISLGGDVTDGAAFFMNKSFSIYAGILSGTDLGAPVTGNSGTTASWVGHIQSRWNSIDRDFILEVTFGSGNTGSIDAFIKKQGGSAGVGAVGYLHLNGNFNNKGLITGRADFGTLTDNDSNRPTNTGYAGVLTGLIGEKGAVGAFYSSSSYWFAGSFVARPAEDVKGASLYLKNLCGSNPSHEFCFLSDAHITAIVNNCNNNPFGTTASEYGRGGCATTLGAEQFNVARKRYCDSGNNRTLPGCRPTATRWGFENPNAASSVNTANGFAQFVKGTADGIDITGVTRYIPDNLPNINTYGALNLKTSTFNNTPLGGVDTDGVAFFRSGRNGSFYAGIFSGTDLGAPITGNSGTTASWVGQFQPIYYETNRDFVLEVTFGNADQNKAGSIEAFIKGQGSSRGVDVVSYHHLKGDFDDSGLITGTVVLGNFTDNDRNSPAATGSRFPGVLTGLIGEKGAVGTFQTYFDGAGGFAARPAEDVDGASLYLKNLCAGDSSHEFCFVSDARITAIVTNCNNNPFGTTADEYGRGGCAKTLGTELHRTKTTQRIELCNNTDNEDDPLCMDTNLTNLCNYAPFSRLCLGNSKYSSERARIFESCRDDPNNPTCNGVSQGVSDKKPNTATWADSFVTSENLNELPSAAEIGKRSQFLKGGKSDLDKTGINVQDHGVLHFETAPVDDNNPLAGLIAGNPDPNSRADVGKEGVAFFWGYKGQYAFYSGILEDTDLGAPVNSVSRTTATWKGTFQSLWFTTETDFDLEVAFGGDQVGTISARIANNGDKTFFSHFFIDGEFDNNGLITGDILAGTFTGGERANVRGTSYPGILRGLIGKEGAVGSFVGGTSADEGNTITGTSLYSGGFIATPPPVVNHADWVDVFKPHATPATPAITQFLEGTAAVIVNAHPNRVVTFATATYNNISLGGVATNGFATSYNDSNNNYYAGLLSTVNLGAPLTSQPAVSVWRGTLRSYTPLTDSSPDLLLTVNFGAGLKAGTISATPTQHVIAGDFDNRGVIDGTVTRTVTRPQGDDVRTATLTGLIGSGGAIGVFHNNEEGPQSLVGGFVACPYDDANNRCK